MVLGRKHCWTKTLEICLTMERGGWSSALMQRNWWPHILTIPVQQSRAIWLGIVLNSLVSGIFWVIYKDCNSATVCFPYKIIEPIQSSKLFISLYCAIWVTHIRHTPLVITLWVQNEVCAHAVVVQQWWNGFLSQSSYPEKNYIYRVHVEIKLSRGWT